MTDWYLAGNERKGMWVGGSSPPSGFAFIGAIGAGSPDGNAFTTGSLDTSGANLLVASVAWFPGGGIPTLTDSKGNTWTELTTSTGGNRGNKIVYTVPSSVGAGHTFSEAQNGVFASIIVAAFNGSQAIPADVENGALGTGTAAVSGTITPGINNELVVATVGFDGSGGSISSINGSFNLSGQEIAYGSGSHDGCGLAYLIQTTAAAANPTWTINVSVAWAARIGSFKSA